MIEKLVEKDAYLAVIGLGYVGLPLAVAFSKKVNVIGFDINEGKINSYINSIDVTNEVGNEAIAESNIIFTSDNSTLKKASVFIVSVPTPIDKNNNPDFGPLVGACKIVGKNLKKGDIVVFESTVYPGATEEICVPILEKESDLNLGIDFKVGYSPERINPGDKIHRLENIVKIVSGNDDNALESISSIYNLIINAGVHKVSSIKVAEAAKVIENAQRDINIAFVNELSKIFNKLGIDTQEVLNASGTKWNFLDFKPGLVGGHCIGVDPYYLTYKAEELGHLPEVILAGRRTNDGMPKYVAENIVKMLIKDDCQVKGAQVLIMGITFKENVPDIRNSKIADIIFELKEYGIDAYVTDPIANNNEVEREYGIRLIEEMSRSFDAIVVAVNHEEYKRISLNDIRKKLSRNRNTLIDLKGLFNKIEAVEHQFKYWRL